VPHLGRCRLALREPRLDRAHVVPKFSASAVEAIRRATVPSPLSVVSHESCPGRLRYQLSRMPRASSGAGSTKP
jgi:hypothetical protein